MHSSCFALRASLFVLRSWPCATLRPSRCKLSPFAVPSIRKKCWCYNCQTGGSSITPYCVFKPFRREHLIELLLDPLPCFVQKLEHEQSQTKVFQILAEKFQYKMSCAPIFKRLFRFIARWLIGMVLPRAFARAFIQPLVWSFSKLRAQTL